MAVNLPQNICFTANRMRTRNHLFCCMSKIVSGNEFIIWLVWEMRINVDISYSNTCLMFMLDSAAVFEKCLFTRVMRLSHKFAWHVAVRLKWMNELCWSVGQQDTEHCEQWQIQCLFTQNLSANKRWQWQMNELSQATLSF